MTRSSADDLAASEYVTVVLRLLIDRQGNLLRGELADMNGVTIVRFADYPDLERVMRAHLARTRRGSE